MTQAIRPWRENEKGMTLRESRHCPCPHLSSSFPHPPHEEGLVYSEVSSAQKASLRNADFSNKHSNERIEDTGGPTQIVQRLSIGHSTFVRVLTQFVLAG
jgi:hypothetical protein